MQKPLNFRLIFLTLIGMLAYVILWSSNPAMAAPAEALTNFLNQSQTDHKRNHELCFAYEDQTVGLPCNAAQLGIQRPESFWLYLHGNNNLDYFQNVADIINGPIKTDQLLPIVDHNSNQDFQTSGSLGYVNNNWGVSFTPARLILFTHIRNPSLPRISLLAAREEELEFQVGSYLDHEWSWGLQARGIHRRFSYNDSYLSDHFTEDVNSLYQVKSQMAYYLEPSLVYTPEDVDWNPVFSLALRNLGQADHQYEPYSFDPSLHIGAALTQNLDQGRLQLGTTGQWYDPSGINKFYTALGINYSWSDFEIFTTLGQLEQQVGFALNTKYLTSSISYAEQDWNYTSSSISHSVWRWDIGFHY